MSASKKAQSPLPENIRQSKITDPDLDVAEVGVQQEEAQERIVAQSQDERQGLHGQDTQRRVTREE